MAFKISDFLTKIHLQNREILKRNEFNKKYHKDIPLLPLLPVPTRDELEKMFGGHFRYLDVLARIGHTGQKVHRVTVDVLPTPEGHIIFSASSFCGSQRWSPSGLSPIFVLESDDLEQVNCDKCLGIRVPGGKTPPAKKRIAIDPETRPKIYYFEYKVDRRPRDGVERLGFRMREYMRGMTEEEAREKLYKQEMRSGFYTRVYEFQLDRIYAWNDALIWERPNS